jgi:hypothetical protein
MLGDCFSLSCTPTELVVPLTLSDTYKENGILVKRVKGSKCECFLILDDLLKYGDKELGLNLLHADDLIVSACALVMPGFLNLECQSYIFTTSKMAVFNAYNIIQ